MIERRPLLASTHAQTPGVEAWLSGCLIGVVGLGVAFFLIPNASNETNLMVAPRATTQIPLPAVGAMARGTQDGGMQTRRPVVGVRSVPRGITAQHAAPGATETAAAAFQGIWLKSLVILLPVAAFIMKIMQKRSQPSVWDGLHLNDVAIADHKIAMAATTGSVEDCGCEGSTVTINEQDVDARLLRSLQLTDADGQRKTVAQVIGDSGKSVVVFLRHLG
jgi:hypothetical protein